MKKYFEKFGVGLGRNYVAALEVCGNLFYGES